MKAIAVTEAFRDLQHTVYLFDGFQLDVTRRRLVSSSGLVQQLNSRAMDALLLLVENAGELVGKRRLMQTVWPDSIVEDNNLNQCVLAIRKALGETAGSNRYIMTVPGRGYRFVCPVREVTQESASGTATVSMLPWRQSRWLWLGAGGSLCLPLLALLLLRAPGKDTDRGIAVELPSDQAGSGPPIILRLRESPGGRRGAVTGSSSPQALARCLVARPDMHLQVQVQLQTDKGEQVWTGSYVAGVRDPHGSWIGRDDASTSCRELVATVRPRERLRGKR